MKLVKECWLALLEAFNTLTGTPTDESQQSLGFPGWPGHGDLSPVPHVPTQEHVPEEKSPLLFQPPSHGESKSNGFQCDYRAMGPGWAPCSTEKDRGCWLQGPPGKGPNGTDRYDIHTNYEHFAPIGTTRQYTLNVTNMTINADGIPMNWGKVFNKTYPGPWIEACWGDEVEITVINYLPFNGTAIHWHGIRMLNTTEMDGVNAVSQCPIAPGHNFTYKFKTWQYGTSWYHSHYSLQYGDGLLGPLTIHGPSTAPYDHPIDPILMTDWNHRSAFMDFQVELEGTAPRMDSILLNGNGSYAGIANGGSKYKARFHYGRKYLLRLINTSVDTTFIFAIDHHTLTVIASDFVPIHPYETDHIVVGIGQRYHVVVHAVPHDYNTPKNNITDVDKKYWIRTIPAEGCSKFVEGGKPDERQGILSYNDKEAIPTTARIEKMDLKCRDEQFEKLRPWLKWNIPPVTHHQEELLRSKTLEVGWKKSETPRPQMTDKFTRWAMGDEPMFLNFSNPTILNLDNLENLERSATYKELAVENLANHTNSNLTEHSWVYMIITGMYENGTSQRDLKRNFTPSAHPMHLHGHDFALLQQSDQNFNHTKFKPKYDNPPRRDVVLLPAKGFIAIAFKADNPGAWAFHCHIAWHASSGLAIQVLERPADAHALLNANPSRLKEINQTCADWKKWYSNTDNFWDKCHGITGFQDDSGV